MGAPTAGAGRRHPELAEAVGYLVNPVPLVADLTGGPTVAQVLERARSDLLGALAHGGYPFSLLAQRLRPRRDPGRSPLVQAMVVVQQVPPGGSDALSAFAQGEPGMRLRLGPLELEPAAVPERSAQLDLTLRLAEVAGDLRASLQFARDLFDETTARRLLDRFAVLLFAAAAGAERPVAALELMAAAEEQQILREWSGADARLEGFEGREGVAAGLDGPAEGFFRQAERTPDRTALVCGVNGPEQLSYRELARRARRLAARLGGRLDGDGSGLGAGPEIRVAVLAQRRPDLVASLLAVLSAGAAYVPVDPAYPDERISWMLEDSGATLAVADGAGRERLERLGWPAERIVEPSLAGGSSIAPLRHEAPAAGHLAYVIYTSGSTGRPKGVAITRRSAAARMEWARRELAPEDLAGVLASTSVCFDLSVFELFAPLGHGGTVVLVGNALDLPGVAWPVTLVNTVPSAMAELVRGGLPSSVRVIALAGEPLSGALAARVMAAAPRARLLNLYGPSEDTTYSTRGAISEGVSQGISPGTSDDGREPAIGRPLPGSRAYVLDRALRPVPAGVPGELALGGVGLARGYLDRPALTAERFVPDPFGPPGQRLYRTGDLARHRPDGALAFGGRLDRQVKVRGFRVEPGEIEAVLARHPAVRECAVVPLAVSRAEPGDFVRLAGCAVPAAATSAGELRAFLAQRLPAYLVPGVIVLADALPLTPNGKVDRRALAATLANAGMQEEGGTAAARSALEQGVAELWRDVLGGASGAGAEDDFFAAGGHSLLAARLLSRTKETFGAAPPLASFLREPTLAALGRAVEGSLGTTDTARLPLVPVGRDGPLPASYAQVRFWLLDRFEPGRVDYNVPLVARIEGGITPARLVLALSGVVRRHEALRTRIADPATASGPGAPDSVPAQVIDPPPRRLPLPVVDLRALPRGVRWREARGRLREEARRPFDLALDTLPRALLVRLGDREHALGLTFHHIACDGWSLGVLAREIGALYRAADTGAGAAVAEPIEGPLATPALQFADFAVWQRRRLDGGALDGALAAACRRLAGVEPLDLPTDRPRGAAGTAVGSRAGHVPVEVPQEVAEAIAALARRAGATPFMVLLAAFEAWLARLSGGRGFAVGTPAAGRGRRELEEMVGCLVNTLVLRADFASGPSGPGGARGPSGIELVRRARDEALAAYAGEEVPFERLVEELAPAREAGRNPLFQAMLAFQDAPLPTLALGDARVVPMTIEPPAARFDLTLSLQPVDGVLAGSLEYPVATVDRTTALRRAAHFVHLLAGLTAAPERPWTDLSLLCAAERFQVMVEWNDTAAPGDGRLLHELVAAQAERTPDAVALSGDRVEGADGESWTYRALMDRAAALACRVRAAGAGPGTRVAVAAERTPEVVAALLGVLGAGGAWVPLDPVYPRARLELLLEDSRPTVLVGAKRWMDELGPAATARGAALVLLDSADGEPPCGLDLEDATASRAAVRVDPEEAAYVIYTSGSTGRPKGVTVPHRAATRFLAALGRRVGLGPEDRLLAVTTLSFDISLLEVFLPLTVGGQVVLADRDASQDGVRLSTLLDERGITVLQATPATWRLLLAAGWEGRSTLRLLCGGEALPRGLADALGGRGSGLWNLYGPTETTVWSAAGPVPAVGPVVVGRPIDGTRIHVLDEDLRPVPPGVAGEVFIAGDGVARGYLDRPGLTAERFLPDPFATDPWVSAPGGRLYRVGDLARHRPDGTLEILGRTDHQLKVRGFRIEPGEVETALAAEPGVREVAVAAVPRDDGDSVLAAWVVPEREGEDARLLDALRRRAARLLPSHLVPSLWRSLAELPRLPNGKLDRRSLPAPEAAERSRWVAPRTPVEEVLAGVWQEVLGVDRVGSGDDFFALGGHSLPATRMISRVRQALGVELPFAALFEAPVLARLAEKVAERLAERTQTGWGGTGWSGIDRHGSGRPAPPLLPAERDAGAPVPLSFAQQRLWFIDRLVPESPAYNMAGALRLEGPLDVPALAAALRVVAARHETLRTRFVAVDGVPRQVIDATPRTALPLVDLGALPEAVRDGRAEYLCRRQARRPFDLAAGPLVRALLVRLSPRQHVLAVVVHHIVADGWSIAVLERELGAAYGALREGRRPALSPLPVQYADFTLWQRRWLAGGTLEDLLEAWRERLAGAPERLELPVDHRRAPGGTGGRRGPEDRAATGRGASVPFGWSPALAAALRALARGTGATPAMVALAGLQALLGRLSGQSDVLVGSPVANRNRREIEDLIGFFANTLVLRTDLSGDPPFDELVGRVRETALAAYGLQDLPFERLIEDLDPERGLARSPLVQVVLSYQSFPRAAPGMAGLAVSALGAEAVDTGTAKFDLTLFLWEEGDGLRGLLEYDLDLFDPATARRLVGWQQRLLEAALETPATPLGALPLLGAAERAEIVRQGAVAGPWQTGGRVEETLISRFDAQVRRAPDAVAVAHEGAGLTYGELDRRARRVAARLRALGLGPGALVPLLFERSLDLVVAVVGVLRAGAAYVPLDPAAPAERVAFLLADVGAEVVVTHRAVADRLPEGPARRLDLSEMVATESSAARVRVQVQVQVRVRARATWPTSSTPRAPPAGRKGCSSPTPRRSASSERPTTGSVSAPRTSGRSSTPTPSTSRSGRSGARSSTAAAWWWCRTGSAARRRPVGSCSGGSG